MEELVKSLLQPLPLGRVTNSTLADISVQVNKTLFIDPAKTLESTMRALYVIKQVLQDDGHVYLINSNPLLTPLLREAALCCVNPNLWFLTEPWAPGSLTDPTSASSPSSLAAAGKGLSRSSSSSAAAAAPLLFRPEHQPNRQLLAARSLAMVNPHCLRSGVLDRPPPRLHALDKWKLFATRRRGGRSGVAMDLLRGAVALEGKASQLLLPRMLQGSSSKLRLMVVLDLTHDMPAVDEAYSRSVMTISLVNAHSDLSRITYPVYAGEYHLRFQHFFLDWIIKVANMPPPPPKAQG